MMLLLRYNRLQKTFLGIILVIIVLIGVWMVDLSVHTIMLRQNVAQLKEYAKGDLSGLSLDVVGDLVKESARHFEAIRRDLGPLLPVFRMLSAVPTLGDYVGQIEPLVVYGDELTKVGASVIHLFEPIWIDSRLEQFSTSQRLLLVLLAGEAQIDEAIDGMGRVATARAQLEPRLMPDAIREDFQKIDDHFPTIYSGIIFLKFLPNLIGAEQPKLYLVIAQNHDELRATGGFISAIGTVQVENGMVAQFDMVDSYSIDDFSKQYPAPPEPINRYMLGDYWLPRDANWSPDFPSSARQAQALYQLSTDVITEGVIAFDQAAVQSLLQVTGPITVEDSLDVINESNVEEYMHEAWAPEVNEGVSEEWWQNRKNFIPSLAKIILQNVLAESEVSRLVRLSQNILEGIQQGHIMVYFSDPLVQEIMHNLYLDGSVRPGEGDFIMLVDSNIGFNKVDAEISRSLEYFVDLSDTSRPIATVKIIYKHLVEEPVQCDHRPIYGNSYSDMQKRCYWNYWRVLTNSGTQLLSAATAYIPGDWLLNRSDWHNDIVRNQVGDVAASFEGLLVLPTGSSQEVLMKFELPISVIRVDKNTIEYSLVVQKQPGVQELPVALQINIPGFSLSASGKNWLRDENSWRWQGTLIETYNSFELVFSRD